MTSEPLSTPVADGELFLAVSRFQVENGMEAEVDAAFRARPHLVDSHVGFVRMEVVRGLEDPREFWLLTWWSDEQSYRTWHKGHTYHAAHEGIPRGLKLTRGSVSISFFRKICG